MPGFGDLHWLGQSEWSWPRMGFLSWEPIQSEEEICSYIIILSLRIYKGILCEVFWVKALPELLQWGWSVKKSCTLNLLETNSRNFRLYGHYPCEEMISWPPWSWQSSCLCTTNTILLNQCCWLWWWPTFWSLLSTCLLCLFPPSSSCTSPITQSHQEFSSPGSSLEWEFCVNLCGDSQWLFVFALHFWFYLRSQIQLRSSCWWLRSSALDLVSVQNKFTDLSLGVALLQLWFILFSSCSSWLKNNFFFPYKSLDPLWLKALCFSLQCDLQTSWDLCPIDPCIL